ncbi:polyunsaturated fatty acid lipoxygenase ALOX15B [Megalops cyprinoides]|uniref:polyunsaturated fatty acid lipoxygenase ALOX15B n=1 Tax=Megalops cyprinoides TaxID=118141 RepID=UPI001864ED86|nr:polyunsaturated fatty acid lipoxygenase ALOX15B [Megalops cyprinoides]
MEVYQVTLRTSQEKRAGTYCTARVTLVGTDGESLPTSLDYTQQHLTAGSACVITVKTQKPLGTIALVRLRLENRPGFPEMDWYCQGVEVKTGGGEDHDYFPCDKWLQTADGDVELRNGKMCLLSSETLQILKDHRLKELQSKQQHIRWRIYAEGVPHCADMASLKPLGPNLSYSRQSTGADLQYLRGFAETASSWSSFGELETLFAFNAGDNAIAKYVQAHWSEDSFFGYQCLNGCNPLMVRQIRHVPPNMAVSSSMLRPFLPEGSSLEQEMEQGTIFLLDYEVVDGVPPNTINGVQQYLAAPLCLLHYDQQGVLKPIAIQLQQTPGPQNPVFVPSDPEPDWLLAKIWVRCADFQCHQLISHFLITHLLGEVYCIATLRQLPEIHPLYQVLMPHMRTTLQINIQARVSLLSQGGVFDKSIACGLEGIPVLLRRGTERLTYRTLCVPDNLSDRGVQELPISYYAQDALRVWGALHSFVESWLDLFYPSDLAVQQDAELQNWIQEIFTHGPLGQEQSGFPQAFQTKMELCKFVTMVIFSCSALHAAVNFSQLDFNLWMPNCPATMSRPPPQSKGTATMEDLLSILPAVNATCSVLITLSLLSQPAVAYVPLGHYREQQFNSGAPQRLVETLQKELRAIVGEIAERNRELQLPYIYLSPDRIENSVAI